MNEIMKETSAVCVPTTLDWDSSICEAAQNSLTSAYFLFRCITGGGRACELSSIANNTVSEFKTFLSLLDSSPSHNRRIRKGPLPNSMEVDFTELLGCRDLPDDVICSSSPKHGLLLDQQPQARPKHQFYSKTNIVAPPKKLLMGLDGGIDPNGVLPSTQSILYSNSADVRSISKQILSFYHAPSIQRSMEDSSVLSSKRKNGCGEGYTASIGECHCSKRRKLRIKRTIRVPAVGSKLAEIPSDDFTWRKYGQKPIKGSPYPRSYYKCSSMRGCPARKHVERCTDDVNMLIVTYEGDHDHPGLTLAISSTTTIPH